MGRNLLPLLILLALDGQASAGEFPKSGEAELINYAMIHEFLTIDGGGAGAFGSGQYSGVVRNVAGSGPFDKASIICSENWTHLEAKWSRTGACITTDQDGDQMMSTFGRGQNNLVSGTGKYAGISGTFSFVSSTRLHEAPREMTPVITQIKAKWELK
jgi:hypothetical protein